MNHQIPSLALFAIFFATLPTHSQSDPFASEPAPASEKDEGRRMVRVLAEFIEMPITTYTGLMASPSSSTNDSDLRAHCAQLMEAGEARMIETLSVNAPAGQNAISENMTEFIFPTEYEPSSFAPLPTVIKKPLAVGGPPAPPVAFEVKNLGSMIEIEAQIVDFAPIVDLRFTSTIITHAAKDVWGTWTNGEVTVETSMPRFYVLNVKTGTQLISGQPQMVAALSPESDSGWTDHSRKIMTFIRADILEASQ